MEDTLEYLRDEMQTVDVFGHEALRKASVKQREAMAPLLDSALEAIRDLAEFVNENV